jgi:nucleoside 2-deoxyribosyltransferase
MKFGDEELDSAYDGVIEPIISDNGLTAIRVDKIRDSGKINDQILENIAKSKFIISDLTGERPNCYYETGFAHALGKELILTIKEKEKIHFDLAGYRFIIWKTESDLRKKLKEQIISILTNS